MLGLDATYIMMSVGLDEAIRLRHSGLLVRARAQAEVTVSLTVRMSHMMVSTLDALAEQGDLLAEEPGFRPQVAPLNPDFFRHPRGRRCAQLHFAMHSLLWNTRSRFMHKLRALRAAVEHLTTRFRERALDIAQGTCTRPRESWIELDQLHFDLNTCLREVIVLLKSTLHCIPFEYMPALQGRLGLLKTLAA